MKKNNLWILGGIAAAVIAVWLIMKRGATANYYTPSGGAASVNPFGNFLGSLRNIASPSRSSSRSQDTWSGVASALNSLPGALGGIKDLFGSYKKSAPANATQNAVAASMAAGTIDNPYGAPKAAASWEYDNDDQPGWD